LSFASSRILYLATGNPGKLREFGQAAAAKGISVEALPHFSTLPACIEDGETFLANARKKALHYSKFVSGLVFADDSGICADSLGGAPGVYSARYSGLDATDVSNNALILSELKKARAKDRAAHYVCVIILACNRRVLGKFEGRADGVIAEAPRGAGGFGYDPYFYFPPLGSTFAELSPAEKFKVSHRGKAFRRLLEFIRRQRPLEG
jgi:XTP/dITP diphosphohydrolase